MTSPHQAVFDAVNAVPGCTADRVTRRGDAFEARVMCLGPSLHRTGTVWKGELDDVAGSLAPYVALQTMRCARAAQLGIDPLAPDPTRLDHILVDRLLREFSPGALEGDVDRVVGRANQLSMPGLQAAVLVGSVILLDSEDDDPRPRALADRSMPNCGYDGRAVTFPTLQQLPDTVVSAAVGLPVRSLVVLDLDDCMLPFIDRTITHVSIHAFSDTRMVSVYTRPDWVPLIQ